jgi:mycofactocin precursor
VARNPLIIVECRQGPPPDLFKEYNQEGKKMKKDTPVTAKNESQTIEEPQVIEEIVVEELSIDGVCGVY